MKGIKVFKKNVNVGDLNCWQITKIDFDNNLFWNYYQDIEKGLGYTFSTAPARSVEDMGYIDAKDCYKKLKSRGYIADKDFVNTDTQINSEIQGFWNLAIDRHMNHRNCGDVLSILINDYSIPAEDVMAQFYRLTK